MLQSLRLAVSTLTRVPLAAPAASVDARVANRRVVGAAMAWAPVVGLGIGAVAAGILALARLAIGDDATLLPAALAVTVTIAITGALHLDGLADTADALGVRTGPVGAQAAAKEPATGVFGVTAVVVAVLLDVAAVATSAGLGRATTALVVGGGAGRLAATWACRATPAAREEGLGAWVAGSVTVPGAVMATVVTVAVAAVVAGADSGRQLVAAAAGVAAVAVGVGAGFVVRRFGTRAFGGLTGDVLGATITCATTMAYVFVALTGSLVA